MHGRKILSMAGKPPVSAPDWRGSGVPVVVLFGFAIHPFGPRPGPRLDATLISSSGRPERWQDAC
jgi:hypothetical protein